MFFWSLSYICTAVCHLLSMVMMRGAARLPVPAGERAEQKAGLRRDQSHDNEPPRRLPQLPVHSAADQQPADSHGGQADLHTAATSSIQCRTYQSVRMRRVTTLPGKSWNLVRPFSRPGKSRKTAKVMESHGK